MSRALVGLLLLVSSACATTMPPDLCITARRVGSQDTPIVLVRLERSVAEVTKRQVIPGHQFVLCEAVRSSFAQLFPDGEFRCQLVKK